MPGFDRVLWVRKETVVTVVHLDHGVYQDQKAIWVTLVCQDKR